MRQLMSGSTSWNSCRRGEAGTGGDEEQVDRRVGQQQEATEGHRGQDIEGPFAVSRQHLGGRDRDPHLVLVQGPVGGDRLQAKGRIGNGNGH